jgi:urea transport system permease protein
MTDLLAPPTAAAPAPPPSEPAVPWMQRDTVRAWGGRLALGAFTAGLFVWPEVLGDPTRTRQWAAYLCFAMVAIGLDIVWGYGGMLALGQGVFFGLGAYAMGMHLTLEQTPAGQVPEFMALYSDYTSLPLLWRPFESVWFAWAAAVIVPAIVAGLLGYLVFHRRIRGAYFAILTQATALIFWLLLIGQLPITAGTNGLTNFTTVWGRSRYEPATQEFLYRVAAVGLVAVLVLGRLLVRSRFGRLLVAVRDGEDRVRFLGYDPARIKTFAFVVGAAMAGLAGAIYAPVAGIVAPNSFTVIPSILLVVLVAVGGRNTLYGAIIGALLVKWAETTLSEQRPDDWAYLQGALFVFVIAFAPGGILGLLRTAGRRLGAARRPAVA